MEQDIASRTSKEKSIPPKRLIIMSGNPGAGKTTTAHRIRQALDNAIVVSRDGFRNPYRGNGNLDEFANGLASIVDRKFYDCVEQLLAIYATVILDATFRESIKRQTAIEFAQKHDCQAFFVECICSHEVLLSRLRWQMLSGQKSFIRPLEDVLAFYIKDAKEPENKLYGASFIRLNTEKNQIASISLQNYSDRFAEQLVEVLEQPFAPSLL